MVAGLDADSLAVLKVGIWNGSRTDKRGHLVAHKLMEQALRAGIQGGTALSAIEGGQQRRAFRSVESEVLSSELPIWMEYADVRARLTEWLPEAIHTLGDAGILILCDVQGGNLRYSQGDLEQHDDQRIPIRMRSRRGTGSMKAPSERAESTTHQPFTSVEALHVQIYTLDRSKVGGKLVYQAVAEYLRQHAILWVSASKGEYGFGEMRAFRTRPGLFRRDSSPIIMHVVDTVDKLDGHLPGLVKLVENQAVVTSARVQMIVPG